MRKLVLYMHQSLYGYCATTDGRLDWIPYNTAFEEYAERLVKTVGSSLYGRVTYELMRSHWPTVGLDPAASQHDLAHAEWFEQVEKIVFSTTLIDEAEKTLVVSDNILETVTTLKAKEGKDLVIFGSPTLARSLMKLNLIDEFQFTVSPVILGEGLTFIRSIDTRVDLELLSSEQIAGGLMGLHYRVKI